MLLREAPVDDQVPVQAVGPRGATGRTGLGRRGRLAGIGLLGNGIQNGVAQVQIPALHVERVDPCIARVRHPHRFDRIARAQAQIEAETILHLGAGGPEGELGLVHATFFERIHIAPDPVIDPDRLQIDEANARVLTGAYRGDADVEGPIGVFDGDAGIASGGALALVDLFGTLLRKHLAGDVFAVDPDRDLGHCAVLGHREGVGRFDVLGMRIVEDMLDSRHGVTVLDQDVDLVIADRECGQRAVARGQQPRGLFERRSFTSSTLSDVQILCLALGVRLVASLLPQMPNRGISDSLVALDSSASEKVPTDS